MDRVTLKLLDRLLTIARSSPEPVQVELLGIAADLLDEDLRRQDAMALAAVRSMQPRAEPRLSC